MNNTRKSLSIILATILLLSVFSITAFATLEDTAPERQPIQIETAETCSEEVIELTVWRSLDEAKNYYGHVWVYNVGRYNWDIGAYYCYYTMTDGSKVEFYCINV